MDPATKTVGEWMPAPLPPQGQHQMRLTRTVAEASILMNAGKTKQAIDLLRPVEKQILVTGPGPAALFAYGRTYFADSDFGGAAAQFSRLANAPGIEPADAHHAIVHVWLGRTHARARHLDEARKAYETFLQLWKEADPDVPLLLQALAEYKKLWPPH